MTACSSKQKANSTGQVASKQVLDWSYLAELATLDPSKVSDAYSGDIINNSMEGLYRLGKVNRELAKEMIIPYLDFCNEKSIELIVVFSESRVDKFTSYYSYFVIKAKESIYINEPKESIKRDIYAVSCTRGEPLESK